MSLTINASTGSTMSGTNSKITETNRKNGIFDGRNLSIRRQEDTYINNRRKAARNQAMKLISDAWKRDDKLIANIQDLNQEKAEQAAKKIELQNRMNDIEKSKEQIREDYGIMPDSDEQKDLELLEKYQNNISGTSYDEFSDEELERLKELQNEPLTEYQKKILSLNGTKNGLSSEMNKIDNKLMEMSLSILMAELEQVKSQDMLNSQDAAEQLLDAAEKDIMQKLIDDGMEAIDEKQEEAEEKAEKAEEKKAQTTEVSEKKKEEQEQKEIIKAQSEAESMEQNYRLQQHSVDNVSEVQKQIQKIMSDNNLINEDLKGIQIDLDF